ncbi:hypothetical protein N658DRAFT_491993 [Parathielavia hyrcaniae]|uniref:Uncharacterized protein n=1 Tax=Parathielavia hyrcaniae TaxID=113614 RepID=A0AAN6QE46_9PEZI|nr:hypothetical protein N658DRAFT_491993 [Parathielavia hyrcaniae]
MEITNLDGTPWNSRLHRDRRYDLGPGSCHLGRQRKPPLPSLSTYVACDGKVESAIACHYCHTFPVRTTNCGADRYLPTPECSECQFIARGTWAGACPVRWQRTSPASQTHRQRAQGTGRAGKGLNGPEHAAQSFSFGYLVCYYEGTIARNPVTAAKFYNAPLNPGVSQRETWTWGGSERETGR